MLETKVRSLGGDSLEEGMNLPWTEEPGGIRSHRVRHN